MRQALGKPSAEPAMATVEKLEMQDVRGRSGGGDGVAERHRGEVEAVLVLAARIDPDRAEPGQRFGVFRGHANRVPGEPASEDLGEHDPRCRG